MHNGATLDYLVRSPADGHYTLRLNYAAVTAGGKVRVWVNGVAIQTIDLAVTGPHYDSLWAPNDFADSQSISLDLAAGVNDVRLEIVSEGYTLNSLKFTGVSQPGQPAAARCRHAAAAGGGRAANGQSAAHAGLAKHLTGLRSLARPPRSPRSAPMTAAKPH